MEEIKTKIQSLVRSNREGDYWDFKREPHHNRANLLHDILCLANSLYKGSRYLVIGVSDPSQGCEVIGLSKGQEHRKSQAEYINFLRDKSFAGNIRPELELHNVRIMDKDVDVLEIFDRPDKPYYLTADYRDQGVVAKAFHIYTRTNDSNTPIDKSADIGIIERMWKQRFGLDLSPLDRMRSLLLKPGSWFKDIGNKSYAYHLDFPEFKIEFSDVDKFRDPYSFFFTNDQSYLGTATFKYHSTTLFELEYMYCDEMRLALAVPHTKLIRLSTGNVHLYYFNLQEDNGIFLQFVSDNLTDLESRDSGFPFIIVDNEAELISFMKFLASNESALIAIEPDFVAYEAEKKMKAANFRNTVDPLVLDRITQLHLIWKHDIHEVSIN